MRWYIAVLCLAFLVSGCQKAIDPDHARMCRIILPAIEPAGANIHIYKQVPGLSNSASRDEIMLFYAASGDPSPPLHIARCTFDTSRSGSSIEQLQAFSKDARLYSGTQLFLLKRFWLSTLEASVADPLPISNADAVPHTNLALAYFAQHSLNGLPLMAIYGLLAAAYSLIFGLVGRINLAFGEIAAIGGYAAFYGAFLLLAYGPGWLMFSAIVLAVYASAFHGHVIGRIVFLPTSRSTGQQALVATLGLAVFLQEYLRLTQGDSLHWIKPIFGEPIALLRAGSFVTTTTPMALLVTLAAVVTAVTLLAFMRHSHFGRNWRAYSDDPLAAQMFGISSVQIFSQTFILACGIAGMAGSIMSLFYGGFGYASATSLGLKALIAAIFGGIGSLPGAFLGGIFIGEIDVLWSAYFSNIYRDLVSYIILTIILIFRPGGLLGFPMIDPRRV